MAGKQFKLSESQYSRIIEASKPTPYLIMGGMAPRPLQERVNDAWKVVADELGCHWDTITGPRLGDPKDVIYAEPKAHETPSS